MAYVITDECLACGSVRMCALWAQSAREMTSM